MPMVATMPRKPRTIGTIGMIQGESPEEIATNQGLTKDQILGPTVEVAQCFDHLSSYRLRLQGLRASLSNTITELCWSSVQKPGHHVSHFFLGLTAHKRTNYDDGINVYEYSIYWSPNN